MACQTEREYKIALRKAGMSFADSNRAIEVIKKDKVEPKMAGYSANLPLNVGMLSATKDESIVKYHKAITEWARDITGFSVVEDERLPAIINLAIDSFTVGAAKYEKDTHSVKIIPEDTSRYVEQNIRSKIYDDYFANHQDITDADLEKDMLEVAKKYSGIENIDSVRDNILSYLGSKDKQYELAHESVHAGAVMFMSDSKNKDSVQMKRMEDLYQFAIDNIHAIDAGMEDNHVINRYWMTNVDEFVAEGLSNPLFINALSKIRYGKKDKLSSMFKEFISTLISMLGLDSKSSDSVYEYLLDAYASILQEEVGNKNSGKIMLEAYKKTDVYKREIDRLYGPEAKDKKSTEERTVSEIGSIMGSMEQDADVLRKMQDGTYKRLTDKSAILSLIDDSFGAQLMKEMIAVYQSGNKLSNEYGNYAMGFVNSVKAALKDSTADDIQHRFEVYDTDNEFTTAFYGDSNIGPQAEGVIDGGTIVVLNGTNQSILSNNAELLLHEFSHSATELAMKQDGKLNRQVAQIQREVMKQLNWTNLVAHIANPTVAEKKRAHELIRYMNGDPSEFLAYAISNPMVFEAMQKMSIKIDTFTVSEQGNAFTKVIDKLKEILNKIISVITAGPTAATALNGVLGNIIATNMNIRTKVYNGETFDDYDAQVTGGKFDKVDSFMKDGSSKIEERLKKLSEMSPNSQRSINKFMDTIGEIRYIRDIRETGIVQSIMHTTFRQTTDKDFAAAFQLIRKVKTENDKEQNSLKEINSNLVNGWYKDIPVDQRAAITDLLAIDPAALGFTRKEQYAELLSNPEQLDAMIAEYVALVGENEYTNQAQDLGWYMMHGESKNPLLQTNAHRIYYRMYNGPKQLPLGEGVGIDDDGATHRANIANIDKLASLFAMKFIDERNKQLIVKLIENEGAVVHSSDVTDIEDYHVVDRSLKLYQTSVENERADFTVYTDLLDKGYLRKAYRRNIKSLIVPEDKLVEMMKRGFGKEKDGQSGLIYSKAATEMRNDGKKYYLMFADDYSVSRTQGAIHDVGFFDKTQQMKDIYDGDEAMYEENTKLVKEKTLSNNAYNGLNKPFKQKTADEMMSREDNLMPVLRLNGDIIDYSLPISRSDAQNHMELDRDIASVLSATITHRSSKAKAIRGNIASVNYLIEDGINHTDDPNYVVLRKSTKEERESGKPYKYDKQWAMIPEYTRDYIFNHRTRLGIAGDANSILIHKDMIDDFIGYKDASLANLQIGENGKYFNMQNHPATALRVEQFQYFLQKLIARYKTILVILDPSTIIGNAWSNFNIAMVHGIPPQTYAKLFFQHWKNLDEYNEIHSELLRTMSERDAGMKGLDNRIAGLQKRLESNSMHELMKDGQFNMIIDDIDSHNNKEDHIQYYKRKAVEKLVGSKGAEKAKDVAENVLLTKDSTSFKVIEKLTAYNDIINRAIIRDKMLFELDQDLKAGLIPSDEKEAKEREILNYVDQLFVNYSYLDNRYIKYANDVGLLLFTKYFLRALKTMKQVYDKKPLALTLFLGIDNFVYDLEDPYKNYFNLESSLSNRVGPTATLDFMEMAKKVLTPGSFGMI